MSDLIYRVAFRPVGGLSFSHEWIGFFKKQPFMFDLHEVWREEFFPDGSKGSLRGFNKKNNEHDFGVLLAMLKLVKNEQLDIGHSTPVGRVIDVCDGDTCKGRIRIEHVTVYDVQY
jgi:hypothetical protein